MNNRPKVKLIGTNGNAFAILGKVRDALKKAGQKTEAAEFLKEAMLGDYDHLLQTVMKYVDVS